MIKTALTKRYRIKEFIQFIRNVLLIVGQNDPQKLKLKAVYEALQQCGDTLQEAYRQNPASGITPQLASLDAQRDQAVLCLYKVSKGYLHHDDAKKAAAGKKVTDCLAKYGKRLHNLNYSAETAALKNLIHDLQTNPDCMAALKEMHLEKVVEVMSQANTAFEALFVQRLEQSSQQDTTKELVELTTEAYRTLVQHIEAHATLTPSESYTSLISHMNENIDHFNRVVARRRSMTADDVAAEENTDTTVNTEQPTAPAS